MPLPLPLAAGLGLGLGGGLLGGIAGAQKDKERATTSINLGPESALEAQARNLLGPQLADIQALLGTGPGREDFVAGAQSQRDLSSLLEQLLATSGLPTGEDINTSQQFAQQIFAPQEIALRQGFKEQNERVNQLAAQLGRPVNDPILQARLAQEQTNQLGTLRAQQGAFAAEQARAMPGQRLGFAQSLAQVRGGLASQALQNRMLLSGLGQELLTQERNFRLGSAGQTRESISGGGFKGALTGALGGASAGLGAVRAFGGLS